MTFRPIVRCVCTDITFAELKESGLPTIEAITEEFGAGGQCGLCREYIARMLRTGQTEFSLYASVESSDDEG